MGLALTVLSHELTSPGNVRATCSYALEYMDVEIWNVSYVSQNVSDGILLFRKLPLYPLHSNTASDFLVLLNLEMSIGLDFRSHTPRLLNRVSTPSEDQINFLQAQIASLGVIEIDDGNEKEVGDHEDQVRFPLNPIDDHRRDHNNGEVPQPIGADANCGSFGAGFQGQNLGNIDPGNGVDGHAVDEHVQEEE